MRRVIFNIFAVIHQSKRTLFVSQNGLHIVSDIVNEFNFSIIIPETHIGCYFPFKRALKPRLTYHKAPRTEMWFAIDL